MFVVVPLTLDKRTMSDLTAVDYKWLGERPALLVRAMVLADKTLFIAGPPDIADEKEAWGRFFEPEIRAGLDEQIAALEGRKGALLRAVSASDGQELSEYNLESPPVWDGMAAANGRLYVAMKNGRILCFGGNE